VPKLEVLKLGTLDYVTTWRRMRAFTDARDAQTADQLWLVEHPPVFTLGQAGLHEHVLGRGDIPLVESDRGGQVTYHGPGQLIAYTLFDVRRLGCNIRELVSGLEQSVIDLLKRYDVTGRRLEGAPGVYVEGAKVSALGLRVRRGCSYHGLALNVGMDLEPFSRINPCGFAGLEVTDLQTLAQDVLIANVGAQLVECIAAHFAFADVDVATVDFADADCPGVAIAEQTGNR
jgi:lipoyl(octanoyl) transferase